ncbi:Ras-related protein RABH1b [Tritrichomonas foetus]|uniref:Ras-related protein RABH1b n=1 Tax=Tritrichomonas foetus TaxID=1144522 RepID=A0A1J4KIY0_9EUKA|nr:Ras-related protein RABH1b [Tritrichomonas foetus]|eukprot:OHT09277.1 Ras-related protein RABH1b [Tritrichomonas foetus]
MSLSQLNSGYKVSFVGDSNVGKTSIITRLQCSEFDPVTTPTVGVSNTQVPIKLNDEKIWLNIWDTAGQERFRSLVPVYTHGANCVVIVFDVSQRTSFESLDSWIQKIHDETDNRTPIVVCANKCDLSKEVSVQECKKWCDENDCELYITSAATGENITELFMGIAQLVSAPKTVPVVSNQSLEDANEGKSNCC